MTDETTLSDDGAPDPEGDEARLLEAGAGASASAAARALAERIGSAPTSAEPPSAPAPGAFEPRAEPSRRRPARIVVPVAATVVALLVALGGSSYLAVSNKSRADRWQERSRVLERNVDELNRLLLDRSDALNSRTSELNRMAAKVRKQESALNQSEADVSSLAARQRALANEKAQVEDSRAQLVVQTAAIETVAQEMTACKDGLAQLLGYVLDQDYSSASSIVYGVRSDCDSAESALSDYSATYG
jgi:hypothetical protein